MSQEALSLAVKTAGGPAKLAKKLGITHQAVIQWRECPAKRVIQIEQMTGVNRHLLRPDLYPLESERAA